MCTEFQDAKWFNYNEMSRVVEFGVYVFQGAGGVHGTVRHQNFAVKQESGARTVPCTLSSPLSVNSHASKAPQTPPHQSHSYKAQVHPPPLRPLAEHLRENVKCNVISNLVSMQDVADFVARLRTWD